MKVLFLSRRFYPEIGGVEKHTLEIGKRLVKKGYKVTVIAEKPQITHSLDKHSSSSSAKATGSVAGIHYVKIDACKDNWFKKFRIWKELWRYRRLIRESDIVHCHDVFFWYLPFRFIFPTKKVFTTFHGYEGNKIPGKKAVFMHKLAEKLSRGNICVGYFLKKWYGTKATFVIYGAVDLNKFKAKNSKNEAVFVGRLEKETGIMKYLEALRILKDKKIDLKLTVLGSGFLDKDAKRYAKENSLNVDFEGFVENVEDYINSAKFVFVSRYLGILEAIAAKKLVFAEYNNAIKKDYLEMAPFAKNIVIENSANDLAEKIELYFKNAGKEKEMVDNAYAWVKNQTWENITEVYLKLWKLI